MSTNLARFFFLFNFWLCWVFVAVHELYLVTASRGASCGAQAPGHLGLVGAVAHALSGSSARGLFLDQRSISCALLWQVDPHPSYHQGGLWARFLTEEVIWQEKILSVALSSGLVYCQLHSWVLCFSLLLPTLSVLGKSGTKKESSFNRSCRIIHWGEGKWRVRKTSKPWGKLTGLKTSEVETVGQLVSQGLWKSELF